LATALHRDALGMVLTRSPGWISHTFKAIERWPTHMHLWQTWEQLYTNLDDPHRLTAAMDFYRQHQVEMHAGAELLWPEEEDLLTLMQMRVEAGHVAFEREKQGSPFDPSACEWPEAYFAEPLWFTDWPSHLQVRTLALDPSKGSDSRRGDYSAYVCLAIDAQGIFYVDADIRRRPTPDMVADGVELVRQFMPDAFGVESNQFQHLLAGELTGALAAAGLPHVSPWLIDNRVSKSVRIRRLGPLLAAKRLRFKTGSPGAALLVEQLRDFPLGDFDDGPDALEMALRLAQTLLAPSHGDGLGDRLPLGG
jgi:predicted phage terminase large subunit-like protein